MMEILYQFISCFVMFVKLSSLQMLIAFCFRGWFFRLLIFEIVLDEIYSFLMNCDLITFLDDLRILIYKMGLLFEILILLFLGRLINCCEFYFLNKYQYMRYLLGWLINFKKFLLYWVKYLYLIMMCFLLQFVLFKFYQFWIN